MTAWVITPPVERILPLSDHQTDSLHVIHHDTGPINRQLGGRSPRREPTACPCMTNNVQLFRAPERSTRSQESPPRAKNFISDQRVDDKCSRNSIVGVSGR